MMNIEEILASAGVSAGAYSVYKIAVRLYQKYYIHSECHHPSENKNEIVITIEERKNESESNEREVKEEGGVVLQQIRQPV